MSRKPAKKKAKAKRNSIENRNALATVLTNPMVLVLVVTIGCVVLAAKFWSDYRTTLRDDPRFGIGPDRITMTAQPTWIRSDFRRTALEGFDWHNRSLLDQELVQEVGQHLEQQLWVRKVVRVEKYPTGLNAEIVYRRPVAMVELATKDLYPVDGDGDMFYDGKDEVAAFLRCLG